MDPSQVVQAFLFALFAVLTTALWVITGPTYDNLLVPELSAGALYPAIGNGGAGFLSVALGFSNFLLGRLVDPAIGVVGLALGVAYLARSFLGRYAPAMEALLPRLVVGVVLANFSVPVAGGLLAVAGAAYPVVAGFDGGAWSSWANLSGFAGLRFSWDNGVLAFVVSFALFSLVLLLAVAVAVRNALLGVLLVLLPAFAILWPVPALSALARRAWMMFAELAFLPVVLVVPLELAVGSPNVLYLLACLAIALGSPQLISLAGGQLTSALGFASAGSVLSGGVQRGLGVASLALGSYGPPGPSRAGRRGVPAPTGATGIARHLARAPFPASIPLMAGEALGRGTSHLFRHVRGFAERRSGGIDRRFPGTLRDLR